MNQPLLAYISFDTVPAPKGAAIHISYFVQALAKSFDTIDLITVAPHDKVKHHQLYPGVRQTELPAQGDNLISRVLSFQTLLRNFLENKEYQIIHFRSIFEGFPLVTQLSPKYQRLIFEVNGLPSIELKYRYPLVVEDRDLLYKLKRQEQICYEHSNLIITPSYTTQKYLVDNQVPSEKIQVIPNGVNLAVFNYQYHHLILPIKILYYGTLSSWQGVKLAIEAIALANRDLPTQLIIIGVGKTQQIQSLKELAYKLKVLNNLTILEPLNQKELVKKMQEADFIVAPLTANDRNLIQGCCPLKIIESMAVGTPVIASDLPVVRELGVNYQHFWLVKPGSAKAIKDAILMMANQPKLRQKIAIQARQQIEEYFTWNQATKSLITAYQKLLNNLSNTC